MMKRTVRAGAFVAVLMGFAPSVAAEAALPAGCMVDLVVFMSPGLSSEAPGLSEGRVGDGRGTIECSGLVGGQPITGPGRYENIFELVAGPVGDSSCAHGRGAGTQIFTIPTTGGPVALSEEFTFTYVGAAGRFAGTALSGAFQFVPLTGDCVTSPVSRAAVHGEGVLSR